MVHVEVVVALADVVGEQVDQEVLEQEHVQEHWEYIPGKNQD